MSGKKRLNLVLESGLCVVQAQIRAGDAIATLFVTDYSSNARVLIDLEKKVILSNNDDIVLTEKDKTNICAALK